MRHPRTTCVLLSLLASAAACEEDPIAGTESRDQVVTAWREASLTPTKLTKNAESIGIAGGDCRQGKVAGLQVDLCEYKDALAADGAKEKGLARIGSSTGAALVRDRYLLVVADVDKVDVHGKTLNKVAKIFLKPPTGLPMGGKIEAK